MVNEPNRQSTRRALVTGGRRGIGAAIVAQFEQHGISVQAPPREELDLADVGSVERYLADRSHENADVDILVNNAGINIINSLEDIAQESWQSMLQINLSAPFRLAQVIAPGMRKRGWGRIINISSIFGIVTRQQRAAYSATKAALAGLTRTLAVELGRDNVLVNCVAPGYVETELTRQNNSSVELEQIAGTIPMGRLAHPQEIAKLVAFLCGDDNTYITGQVLVADGGFTCL
ncbi:MAG TPA: SDR family oxidoreductase [Pirellulales bacterium]|jgi:3-oxoacyl-[acyl-carrier protein] reductase